MTDNTIDVPFQAKKLDAKQVTVGSENVLRQNICISDPDDPAKVANVGVNGLNVAINTAIPTGSNTIGSIANTSFAATQSGTWTVLGSGQFAQNLNQVNGATLSVSNPVLSGLVLGGANVSASNPITHTLYTNAGAKALYPNFQSYSLNCITGSIGAIAAGVTVFSMRNLGTKTAYVKRVTIESHFLGTAAATISHFQLVRFTTATPTGGTLLTVAKKRTANAATTITDARFLVTGLTTTGVVFTDILAGHSQNSQLAAQNETIIDTNEHAAFGRIELAPDEGLCIRSAIATTIASVNLNINIEWDEV